MCFGQLAGRLKPPPVRCNAAALQPASPRHERVAELAALPSTGHYLTRPRRDTLLPVPPALSEAGVGPSAPGDKSS